MPLTVSGLCKPAGAVLTLASFRSKVSVWLGAPAIRMKITFCAVFLVVTPAVAASRAFAGRPRQERCRDARAHQFHKVAPRGVRAIEKRLVIPGMLLKPAIDFFLFVAHDVALA